MFTHLSLAAALIAILAGAVSAAPVSTSGKGVLSVTNISETVPTVLDATVDTAFAQLPGAARSFSVSSPSDLFTVTFSAETQCRDTSSSAATGWCAFRIVASRGSTVVVFNPDGATNGVNIRDATIDSNPTGISNNDEWESHSVTQSRRLPTGVWTIRAQYAVEITAGPTTFWLDDWNLNILVSD